MKTNIGDDTKNEVLPGEIIDQRGEVVEPREYATWSDLCEPPAVKEVQMRDGKWVMYRPWLPLDVFTVIQQKASVGRRGGRMDNTKFMTLVLQNVLIKPKIVTPGDMKAARKADANLVMGIVNDVIDTSMFQLEEGEEELGE